MRLGTVAVLVAIMVFVVSPWLMATFDCASFSTDLLGIIFPATGRAPQAQHVAQIIEDAAKTHGLTAKSRVDIGAPHAKDPAHPENRIQDTHIEVDVEKKLLVGTKKSHFTYDIGLGGDGAANSWPLPAE